MVRKPGIRTCVLVSIAGAGGHIPGIHRRVRPRLVDAVPARDSAAGVFAATVHSIRPGSHHDSDRGNPKTPGTARGSHHWGVFRAVVQCGLEHLHPLYQ